MKKAAEAAFPFGVRPALPAVNFDIYARSVHVTPMMIVAITPVHVEARSTGHALAFAKAVVTNFSAHTIRLRGAC
jgi:hypothetical protein